MKLKILIAIYIASMLILTYYTPAYSEPNIDSATRELDRPFREEAEQKLGRAPIKKPVIKEEEEVVPAEFKGPKFFVKNIVLLGTEVVPEDEFRSIVEKYENRDVAIEELNILTKQIEREYLRRGIIAACFLPPQDVKDGVVMLQVVEALMGDLKIEQDSDYFNKDRLAYYWSVDKDEVMRYDKISRSMQFMDKNPDREVRSTLYAGKRPKTTDVLLKSKTYFPIHVTGSLDREGVPSTGRIRLGAGGKHNNFLGLDDTFLAGYLYGAHFSDRYFYHSVPITNYGTTAVYGYYYGKAFPKKEYTPYNIASRVHNTSAFIHQDLFVKDEYKGEVYFGFEAKDKSSSADTGTINRDRLRIIRAGSSYLYRGTNSITTFKPELSQGINGFGARRRNPYSSRGARNVFTKANLELTHAKALTTTYPNLRAHLKAKAQIASTRLTPQEEFFLGGIDSVRGYPSGDYLADDAFQANIEVLIPAFLLPDSLRLPYSEKSLKDDTTGVVFYDYGYGRKRFPTQSEKRSANMAGIGAGIRVMLYNQALIRMEWGFPVHDKPITEAGKSKFHFSVDFEDKLPREIERISNIRRKNQVGKLAWDILNRELKNTEGPIAKAFGTYLYLAGAAYKDGDFAQAKKYYQKITDDGASLYEQVQMYINECYDHRKALRKRSELAMRYYKEGDIEKAKNIWEEVVKEAKFKSLTLDI